jgi:hypothetical protein
MNHSNEIRLNDVWRRNEPLGDEYDLVKVGGLVDESLAGRPNEYTLKSELTFSPTIQTDAAGLLQHATLVSRLDDPDGDWVSDVD